MQNINKNMKNNSIQKVNKVQGEEDQINTIQYAEDQQGGKEQPNAIQHAEDQQGTGWRKSPTRTRRSAPLNHLEQCDMKKTHRGCFQQGEGQLSAAVFNVESVQ